MPTLREVGGEALEAACTCTYRTAARNMGGSFVFVTDALQHSATNALPCGYPAAALIRANAHTLECPMRWFKSSKEPQRTQ